MTIEDAQERAYALAHDIVIAATTGDEAGVEALMKVLAIEAKTILNMVRRSSQGTS